ncbi:MAG: hypothetical protein ACE5D2_07935 [Fidelibacterota bacterium]
MKINKLILMLSVTSVCAWGQSNPDSLFVLGNRYYEQEQFQEAAQVYERMMNQVEHADLYYNLGNTYYRLGNLGHTIWAYEKGLALAPRHRDLRYNLAIANAQVRDRIEVPKAIFLLEWYHSLMKRVTVRDLISLGSLLILLAAVLFWLRSTYRLRLRGINGIIIFTVVMILVVHGLALDKYWALSDKQEGVVIASTVEVRSAPIIRSDNVVFRIHEGVKMEITQTQPGWYEIILLDGKKGWLAAGSVRIL